jgi:hypothetical protein
MTNTWTKDETNNLNISPDFDTTHVKKLESFKCNQGEKDALIKVIHTRMDTWYNEFRKCFHKEKKKRADEFVLSFLSRIESAKKQDNKSKQGNAETKTPTKEKASKKKKADTHDKGVSKNKSPTKGGISKKNKGVSEDKVPVQKKEDAKKTRASVKIKTESTPTKHDSQTSEESLHESSIEDVVEEIDDETTEDKEHVKEKKTPRGSTKKDVTPKASPRKKRKTVNGLPKTLEMFSQQSYTFKIAGTETILETKDIVGLFNTGVYIVDKETKGDTHTDPIDVSMVKSYAEERRDIEHLQSQIDQLQYELKLKLKQAKP